MKPLFANVLSCNIIQHLSKANDKPALAAHRVATYENKRNAEYLAYETEIQEENIYNNATV